MAVKQHKSKNCCGGTIVGVKRRRIKSCCGGETLVFEMEKPIRKFQIEPFRKAGFTVPPNFYQHNLFYVTNGRLVARASFGSNKINVSCHGTDCPKRLYEFEQLLLEAIEIKKV